MTKGIRKYSLTIKKHRTSISLEEPFYDALVHVARAMDKTVPELIGEIDENRQGSGLSSAVRIFLLDHFRSKIGK